MSTIDIFNYLKKAFDTLCHEILVNKLKHYGIRGIANKWIISYLPNRKQYASKQDTRSECKEILCGAPQGSFTAPNLITIYTSAITYI